MRRPHLKSWRPSAWVANTVYSQPKKCRSAFHALFSKLATSDMLATTASQKHENVRCKKKRSSSLNNLGRDLHITRRRLFHFPKSSLMMLFARIFFGSTCARSSLKAATGNRSASLYACHHINHIVSVFARGQVKATTTHTSARYCCHTRACGVCRLHTEV
jgi:hypothetical protein